MEEIRKLNNDEMIYSHELINYAFKQPQDTENSLIQSNPEDILGCFIDGTLASNIVILPMQTWIQNTVHNMGLICGVASWPEYRKYGTVTRLMHKSLEIMRESDQSVSFLGPFSVPFYRNYGWEMMYDYKKYKLKAEAIPKWQGRGHVKRISADSTLLNPIYEDYAKRYNGMFVRNEQRWANSIFAKKKGMIAVYYNELHEARGYMISQFVKNELQIFEFIYLDQDSQKGLWEFINKQDSMYEFVTIKAPNDDSLHFQLENPKGLDISLHPHFMVRIVDVAKFIEKYLFSKDTNHTTLYLNVHDSIADWNNGYFKLEIAAQGEASITPVHNYKVDSKHCITCDIQTLSTMMIGYQSPTFLHLNHRLIGNTETIQKWETLIHKKTTFCLDYGY